MGLCGAAQHFQRILTETLREMLFVNASLLGQRPDP